jgi:hypothetical protein
MSRALAEPALQVLAAAGTLVAFTWPFLVFDKPIQVFVWFFVTWLLVIGLLFAFSRAKDERDEERDADGFAPFTDESGDA